MIKTEYKLICDHCSEEITDTSRVCVINQGKFIGLKLTGLDEQLANLGGAPRVAVDSLASWHFHLVCYDDSIYAKRLTAELLDVKRLEFEDEPTTKFYKGTHEFCAINYRHNHSTAPLRNVFRDSLND